MDIARSRIEIDCCRQLVLDAARKIDTVGSRGARKEIAMIKVFVPSAILRVLDRAIQAFGGAGVSQDTFLAQTYAAMRTLRLADGESYPTGAVRPGNAGHGRVLLPTRRGARTCACRVVSVTRSNHVPPRALCVQVPTRCTCAPSRCWSCAMWLAKPPRRRSDRGCSYA